MKKQLLYAFAFFGAMTFASAQTAFEIDNTDGGSGTLALGTSATGDVAFTPGTDVTLTNHANEIRLISTVTTGNGSLSFELKTNEGNITTNLSFEIETRVSNTLTGNIIVDGVSEAITGIPAGNPTANQAFATHTVNYPNTVTLNSTNSITVTINVTSLTKDNTTLVQNAQARFNNVQFSNVVFLSSTTRETSSDPVTNAIKLQNNPVSNELEFSNEDDIKNISVYSINGQLVKSFSQGEYIVSDLATGVYSVRITTTSGSKSVKIIKE